MLPEEQLSYNRNMDKYIIQMYVYVKQLFLMNNILFYFIVFKFI